MKDFAYNWITLTLLGATIIFAALSSGCTWTTTRPTDPYAEARKAKARNDNVKPAKTTNKFDRFLEDEVASGRAKKLSAKIRFVPELLPMGRDVYGLRFYGLPKDHALLARGYVPGEILLSFNGRHFTPVDHEMLGRLMLGQLDDVHLTVLRDGREVSLEPVEGHRSNLMMPGPVYDEKQNKYVCTGYSCPIRQPNNVINF